MVESEPKTAPQGPDARRWWLGVSVTGDVSQLVVVLVASQGDGREAEIEIVDGMRAAVPEELAAAARALITSTATNDPPAADAPGAGDSLAKLARVREELTDLAASVIENFAAQACVPSGRVLVLGALDPGVWTVGDEDGKGRCCLSLCDAARLAQRTGLNVIDAFAQRDLAGGGLGGPITALAQGVVLGPSPKTRLVVDFGRTTRLTLLGPTTRGGAPQRVLAFDAGPGMELVDLLVRQLTGGEHPFDPGGRFAVQGSRVDALLAQWLADPMFRRPPPRWDPLGVDAKRFAAEANRQAIEQGWSVRDMVCTATHLVADVARQAAAAHLPREAVIEEVVVIGRGQHNGMLLRELSQRFAPVPIVRLGDLGIEIEAFDPACVAVLAMFFVDQTPGSLPELTGVDMPRVLGRITPGSPKNWQRLLTAIGASRPAIRPLRAML